MRAIVVEKAGGPDVLTPQEIPRPAPGTGSVLVRVDAVGVNFIDVYFRDGTYTAPLPLVPGQEAAGVVVDAAEGALEGSGIVVGDRVAWATARGAYAEYASVPVDGLVPLPEEVTTWQAASVLLQGLAARYLTHATHVVRVEEVVVVHAGGGGLGRLLVQFAVDIGATVIATASTKEKRHVAREAGAHAALAYEDPETFRARVDEISGGEGASVVYDSVGAATFESSLRVLGRCGHLVLCGLSSGRVPPFDLDRLRAGSLTVSRPSLADHTRDPEVLRASARDLFGRLAAGRLWPLVYRELPLERADSAHELLESRTTTGKLLLIP